MMHTDNYVVFEAAKMYVALHKKGKNPFSNLPRADTCVDTVCIDVFLDLADGNPNIRKFVLDAFHCISSDTRLDNNKKGAFLCKHFRSSVDLRVFLEELCKVVVGSNTCAGFVIPEFVTMFREIVCFNCVYCIYLVLDWFSHKAYEQ